jgi:uncharacterized protein YjiS (DUF1127 family)
MSLMVAHDDAGLEQTEMGRHLLSNLVQRVKLSLWRRRVENQLLALDDRMLSDIGVNRCDVAARVRQITPAHLRHDVAVTHNNRQAKRTLLHSFRVYLAACETNRQLERLSDAQLADVGVSRGAIPGLAWKIARQEGLPSVAPAQDPVPLARNRVAFAAVAANRNVDRTSARAA